ncbi:MAG: PAS domain S-box protein [candidate division WOR-3 bacterium]|nr:MAG: PAS domain S-box protein [candidate division WOR-3 bacterium]
MNDHSAKKSFCDFEKTLGILFDITNDLVHVADTNGKIIIANHNWLSILGYAIHDLRTIKISDIVREDLRSEFLDAMEKLGSGQSSDLFETVFVTRQGKQFPVNGKLTSSEYDGEILLIGTFSAISKKYPQAAEADRFTTLCEHLPYPYFLIDNHGVIIACNDDACDLSGYTHEELMTVNITDGTLFSPLEDTDTPIFVEGTFLSKGAPTEYVLYCKNASRANIEMTRIPVIIQDHQSLMLIVRDITAQRKTEQALQESEERYRDLVEHADVAIAIQDATGAFKYANKRCADLFGYGPEAIMKQSISTIIHPDDTQRFLQYHRARMEGKFVPRRFEVRGIRRDGRTLFLEVHTAVLRSGDEITGTRSYLWDISMQKDIEKKLRILTLNDQLTGLYNRRGFNTLTIQQMKYADRMKKGLCILYADLDNLKWINDSFGHREGDQAIRSVAKIFRNTFRDSDIIARVGGDEFAVCVTGAEKDDLPLIRARLQKTVKEYNILHSTQFDISISIGTTYYDPDNPLNIDELLTEADARMYATKWEKNNP